MKKEIVTGKGQQWQVVCTWQDIFTVEEVWVDGLLVGSQVHQQSCASPRLLEDRHAAETHVYSEEVWDRHTDQGYEGLELF